jgi:hypothetical protein
VIKLKFIASVAERDIDLIVMEEFSVNDEFRDWFSSRIYGETIFLEIIGTWHSVVVEDLGESDIVFVFQAHTGQRIALLIENKINALPQPKQSKRYKIRGQKGIMKGDWDEFRTCLIAPSKYFGSIKNTESYDTVIAYEELLSFFSSRRFRDDRYKYKAKIIQEAIEQNRRGYQPEYNQAMTEFVKQYVDYAVNNFKDLGIQEAKPRPSGSTWVMFNPHDLPKHMSLCHQLTAGTIKLFFSGPLSNIESVQEKYKDHINEKFKIAQTGKSVAISAEVKKVSPLTNSFEQERDKIIEALNDLREMLKVVCPV